MLCTFYEQANKQRADIRDYRRSPDCNTEFNCLLKVKGENLEITAESLKLRLRISERYTEDLVFAEFVRTAKGRYETALSTDPVFSADVDVLRSSILKQNGYYVLNLSRRDVVDEVMALSEAEVKRVTSRLALFDDKKSLGQLKDVLYQIRCNVFHGEKIPGDLNDDRIVSAATPVLKYLLQMILEPNGQQ